MARKPTLRVSTGVVRYFVSRFGRLGVDTEALVKRCRLKPWEEYGPMVPRDLLTAVWDAAVESSPEPGLGIRLAERSRRSHWTDLGQLASSSATVGEALLQMSRATRLISDSARVSFSVEADRCAWTLDPVAADRYHREHVEFLVASAVLMTRRYTKSPVDPLEVFFRHPAPADIGQHERLFRAPIRFAAARNGFDLDSSIMRRPLATHDAERHAALADQVDRLLKSRPDDDDLERRVRLTIQAQLPEGEVTAEEVAGQLGLHPKTLARKLRAMGTSYRELLEDQRYALATRYLARRDLSLEQVALMLGYSEKSAFHRAFKRWSGLSPIEFRRRTG